MCRTFLPSMNLSGKACAPWIFFLCLSICNMEGECVRIMFMSKTIIDCCFSAINKYKSIYERMIQNKMMRENHTTITRSQSSTLRSEPETFRSLESTKDLEIHFRNQFKISITITNSQLKELSRKLSTFLFLVTSIPY
jgi:hypothetical protein